MSRAWLMKIHGILIVASFVMMCAFQALQSASASTPTPTSTQRPTLTPTSTTPPLVSDVYLNDRSILDDELCGPPCVHGITVGKTSFVYALDLLRKSPLFSDVQFQDNPPQAAWATKGGTACCQMTADGNRVVDAILLRVAPAMTVGEIIQKLGEPPYISVLAQDYSDTETAIGLIYPESGNVLWAMPGDGSSTLDENDPIVIVLYLDPAKFGELLDTATLQGWMGYKSVSSYRTATPIVTPRVTLTPAR